MCLRIHSGALRAGRACARMLTYFDVWPTYADVCVHTAVPCEVVESVRAALESCTGGGIAGVTHTHTHTHTHTPKSC
jgi:hypothetical protein